MKSLHLTDIVSDYNEVALAEIKIGTLQREKQTEIYSQIWAKSDIQFLRYGCWKFVFYFESTSMLLMQKIGKYAHELKILPIYMDKPLKYFCFTEFALISLLKKGK